eukprot:1800431-Pleurochrysis_carterae.AAC.15
MPEQAFASQNLIKIASKHGPKRLLVPLCTCASRKKGSGSASPILLSSRAETVSVPLNSDRPATSLVHSARRGTLCAEGRQRTPQMPYALAWARGALRAEYEYSPAGRTRAMHAHSCCAPPCDACACADVCSPPHATRATCPSSCGAS